MGQDQRLQGRACWETERSFLGCGRDTALWQQRRDAEGSWCVWDNLCHHSSKSESEVTQSCLTLCNPTDYSPPGSSIHGIFQARVLQWVAFSSPGDLPDPGIEPRSPSLQADALQSEPPGKPPFKTKTKQKNPLGWPQNNWPPSQFSVKRVQTGEYHKGSLCRKWEAPVWKQGHHPSPRWFGTQTRD